MLWSHLSNVTFRDSKMNFCKDKVRQETLRYCQCRTEFSWQAHLNDFSYFPPDRRPTTNDFHQWGSGAHLQRASARVTLLQPGWWAISSKGQQLRFLLSFPLDPPQHTGKSGRLPGGCLWSWIGSVPNQRLTEGMMAWQHCYNIHELNPQGLSTDWISFNWLDEAEVESQCQEYRSTSPKLMRPITL